MSKTTEASKNVELSEFVQGALEAIIRGVNDAQNSEFIKSTGAVINPSNINWSDEKKSYYQLQGTGDDNAPRVESVEFDIAVTSEKHIESKSEGAGGVNIQVIKSTIGAGWNRAESQGLSNRLKFSVLVLYPPG